MTRTHKTEIRNWRITFRNNVHMYCHSLSAEKNETKFDIPCEDLPEKERMMGIWIEDLKTSEETKRDLSQAMFTLAKELDYQCRVYLGEETLSSE